MMKIALDYDQTYSADPYFWQGVIKLAQHAGHEIRIVTARDDRFDRTEPLIHVEQIVPVIYCRGVAKKWHLTHFGDGFVPDIWIDDKPESITTNSSAPPEGLAEWRANRGEAMPETWETLTLGIGRDMERKRAKDQKA
ncbi:hypothetical protein [Mesorhizobium sp. M7A.F.Ca.CA.002.12.1.1]|uniref:hypothetical protein n=1 Tax=Mesorhizobium sp. M7A.F.Ca.CA.002.12.1.1 TaxID=2496735 RepID=UPI000FCB1A76|nr:hypothetical protein [Mesorhizobium sp. M7A.F.Ca.CA.002.12.1.1]RUX60149.1 hypothetical protein EN989_11055 [Mesorhizobium sp. M7A.F.Ca.CA.002.12.1.1]